MPGTKFSYGNKLSGIKGLRTKILAPALTSHYEVKIPVGSGTLNSILKPLLGTDGQENLNISCSEASLPGSSIATFEIKNDYAGVTERYAHRRMYDDRIDFTFYVDSQQYLPIRFFERWMRFVTGESGDRTDGETRELVNPGYHYRMNFPESYRCERGLKIVKFERDYKNSLEYEFIGAYPIAVSSMPVGYDSSSLLKCTVSMTYLRYVITELTGPVPQPTITPDTQTPDVEPKQELPEPIKKESKVNESTSGQLLYDSSDKPIDLNNRITATISKEDAAVEAAQRKQRIINKIGQAEYDRRVAALIRQTG